MPPRTLKRRSDAISRDDESDTSPPPRRQTQQQQQRRRRASTPASEEEEEAPNNNTDGSNPNSDSDSPTTNTQTTLHTLSKKLVRLAISTEYARLPLRRSDINAKIMKDATSTGSRVQFRSVFNEAQRTLRDVFGMELVDLPMRERTGINERRKAISQKAAAATQRETQRERERETQTQTQKGKDSLVSAQSWILVTCLPMEYRVHPTLFVPSRAPDESTEATYIALYTLVIAIIYLHTPSVGMDTQDETGQVEDNTEPISDAKLQRHLSRLQLENWAPIGGPGGSELSMEKLLARMVREGYLDKRKDSNGGEEVVEWVVGPRGKKEIGRKGVAAVVRGVYGFGVDGRGKGLELPREEDDESEQEGDADEREVTTRPKQLKMEKDELERRLRRTLGEVVTLKIDDASRSNGATEQNGEEE